MADFYPRPPRGGRLGPTAVLARLSPDFYPRPPRGGRQALLDVLQVFQRISIHALREEGDRMPSPYSRKVLLFLSTPSARRATISCKAGRRQCKHFYPRPPRGGRPSVITLVLPHVTEFLSTPSARRATCSKAADCASVAFISIHALREEGDLWFAFSTIPIVRFLSTPSARRATTAGDTVQGCKLFLSTPSARRATVPVSVRTPSCQLISIHALREEGDKATRSHPPGPAGFLSTPSARRATLHSVYLFHADGRFLSTPSARRATAKTETKSLFSYKLYNILHEFRRALIYNGSKNYPNHAK